MQPFDAAASPAARHCRAPPRAPRREASVPVTRQLGRSCASAMAMAPEPVPRSATLRRGRGHELEHALRLTARSRGAARARRGSPRTPATRIRAGPEDRRRARRSARRRHASSKRAATSAGTVRRMRGEQLRAGLAPARRRAGVRRRGARWCAPRRRAGVRCRISSSMGQR